MHFIFFTRTDWDEPPRLRHQLARLLVDHGHTVTFFQKPRMGSSQRVSWVNPSLKLVRHRQMLNHQFKFIAPARWLDNQFVRHQITSLTKGETPDVIVNFNYDYYYLSELFPGVPVVHIVNDDFVAAAIPPNRKSAARLQSRSARDAGYTLCVSYMLLEQIRKASLQSSLFLPWVRSGYTPPTAGLSRSEVLSWGYINNRYDFDTADRLLDSGMKINFFGSVTRSDRTDTMLNHPNAVYHGVADLKDVPEVLARCCCSILPYNANDDVVRCITISNRGFELLGFGMPLLYTDLPRLIEAPGRVIYRCSSIEDFQAAYLDACENFDGLQSDIQAFLGVHNAQHRYLQFMDVIKSVQPQRHD